MNQTPPPDIDLVLELWERLAARERRVFLAYGWRLLAGQKKFGPLTMGKKKWDYEAIEEAIDASVYLTSMLVDNVDRALANAISDAERELDVAQDEGSETSLAGGESSGSA